MATLENFISSVKETYFSHNKPYTRMMDFALITYFILRLGCSSPNEPKQNHAPHITDYKPKTATVTLKQNEHQQFSITVKDPDNDTMYYSWSIDDSVLQSETKPDYDLIAEQLKTGNHTLMAKASDKEKYASQSWQLIIKTIQNMKPTNSITPNTANLLPGQSQTFRANPDDQDHYPNQTLENWFIWQHTRKDGTVYTVTNNNLAPGNYILEHFTTDGQDTTKAEATIIAAALPDPTLTINQIAEYIGNQLPITWNGQNATSVALYLGTTKTDTLDALARNLAINGNQTFNTTAKPEGLRYVVAAITNTQKTILYASNQFFIDHTKPYLEKTTNLTSPVDPTQPLLLDLNDYNADGSQEAIDTTSIQLIISENNNLLHYQTSFEPNTNKLIINTQLELGKTYQLSFSVQDKAGNLMEYSTEFQTKEKPMEWKQFEITLPEDSTSQTYTPNDLLNNPKAGTTIEAITTDKNKISIINHSDGSIQFQAHNEYNTTEQTPIDIILKALNTQTTLDTTIQPRVKAMPDLIFEGIYNLVTEAKVDNDHVELKDGDITVAEGWTDANGNLKIQAQPGTYRLHYTREGYYDRITQEIMLTGKDSVVKEVRLDEANFPLLLLNEIARGKRELDAPGDVNRWTTPPLEIVINTSKEKTGSIDPDVNSAYNTTVDILDNDIKPATKTILYPDGFFENVPVNKKDVGYLDWMTAEYIPGKIVIQFEDQLNSGALVFTALGSSGEVDGAVITIQAVLNPTNFDRYKSMFVHELAKTVIRVEKNSQTDGNSVYYPVGTNRPSEIRGKDKALIAGSYSRMTKWKSRDNN